MSTVSELNSPAAESQQQHDVPHQTKKSSIFALQAPHRIPMMYYVVIPY